MPRATIAAGTVVTEDDIAVKSPGQGLSPLKMPALIGRKLSRAMAADDYFFPSDLSDGAAKARRYRFDRPWGVPVRYHDAEKFLEICQPDIIEFHLSYNDMERDPGGLSVRHLRSRLRRARARAVRRQQADGSRDRRTKACAAIRWSRPRR